MVINADNINNFTLECIKFHSCAEIHLNVTNFMNAVIICYETNACDGITIWSDSNNVLVSVQSFSEDILINVPSKMNEIYLNCNHKESYLSVDSNTFNLSDLDIYSDDLFGGRMPCDDVIYFFHQSHDADCEIKYEFYYLPNETVHELSFFTESMKCYSNIFIADIANYSCIGTNSPTHHPTIDPTSDPTSDPTITPTYNPTANPTYAPTIQPTYYPTTDPTSDPSIDPTSGPTYDPTITPTYNPTANPTYAPTIQPTYYPTTDPTSDPTTIPTHDPIEDPTFNPTISPTRNPTPSNSYNSYFMIRYLLLNLTKSDIHNLLQDPKTKITKLREIIEEAYFEVTKLPLRFFWLEVQRTLGIKIKNIKEEDLPKFLTSANRIDLNSIMKCNRESCEMLLLDHDSQNGKEFLRLAQTNIREYFSSVQSDTNASNIIFEIDGNALSNINELHPSPWIQLNKINDVMFITFVIFTILCAI
eukprot:556467_1